MTKPDLNLLKTLDALIAEGSVVGAAKRLRLSPSAMSRALARLRRLMGDPILVRAGRSMVATPRALELRPVVGSLLDSVTAILQPARPVVLKSLEATFTLQNRDGFVENFGPDLIARAAEEAPGLCLRFVQKPNKDSKGLRDGSVDLETAVLGDAAGPELRVTALFRDRYIGVARKGHPIAKQKVTRERYAAAKHIQIAIREQGRGPLEDALEQVGLIRKVSTVVGGFSEALALARSTDLIATVPEHYTCNMRGGMHSFSLPIPPAEITVSLLWHPRHDADPAHRWLRNSVLELCRKPSRRK
ncbi:MAG: LysR family transcriptional regulator [Aestuariivirga sp.]